MQLGHFWIETPPLCKAKVSHVFLLQPLKCENLLLSCSFLMANEETLGFGLLVGREEQFEGFSLGSGKLVMNDDSM